MRTWVIGLFMGTVAVATSASAYDADHPANCNGVDWDDTVALVVAKVTAQPRVNFIKSRHDDEFNADTCPCGNRGVPQERLSCGRRPGAGWQDEGHLH